MTGTRDKPCGMRYVPRMTTQTQTREIPARKLRAGDVILTTVNGEKLRTVVTSDARKLGGTGLVGFGLTREGRDPWQGRLRADTLMTVTRA